MSRVLVVDDDHEIRESIVDLLLDEGFEVTSAPDGWEGLRVLRKCPAVCVILLDLRMPGVDGRTFRREQLADPAVASVPVIVLSADRDYAEAAIEMRASCALSKPFLPDALLEAVRTIEGCGHGFP